MKEYKVVIISSSPEFADYLQKEVQFEGVTIYSGASLDYLRGTMAEESIDMVISHVEGPDLPQIIEHVTSTSPNTSIYIKGNEWEALPFIYGLLAFETSNR